MKLPHAILLLACAASATAQFNGGSLPDLSQLGDIPGLAGSGLDSTLAGLGDMFNNRECLQERCPSKVDMCSPPLAPAVLVAVAAVTSTAEGAVSM
jgi:hypothetical protein